MSVEYPQVLLKHRKPDRITTLAEYREAGGYTALETIIRGGDPAPVYRRLRDRGRLMPEGLVYVSSWIVSDLTRC